MHQLGAPQKRSRFQEPVGKDNEASGPVFEELPRAPKSLSMFAPLVTPDVAQAFIAAPAHPHGGAQRIRPSQPDTEVSESVEVKECVEELEARTAHWQKFQQNVKAITLNDQDVAAVLSNSDEFFLDLPYLDGVLPSMQTGDQFYVPVFLQKVVLPVWLNHRVNFIAPERAVLRLSQPYLFPAMEDYLDTVFVAAVLQRARYPFKLTAIRTDVTIDMLSQFIREVFGVDIVTKLGVNNWTIERLKERIARDTQGIPSLVMIAKQWGFDDVRVASNILRMGCMDKAYLKTLFVPFNERTATFLRIISEGRNVLPNMQNLTVSSIAWTLKPDFIFKKDPVENHQIVLPVIKFQLRMAEHPLSRVYRGKSLKELVRALEVREARMNRSKEEHFESPEKIRAPRRKRESADKDGKKGKPRNAVAPPKMAGGGPRVAEARSNAVHTYEPKPLPSLEPRQPEPFSSSQSYDYVPPGSDLVGPEHLHHPAWFSPQRSDNLFLSSPGAFPKEALWPFDGTSEDTNGKAEAREYGFSGMLWEDPLRLFDDTYGFHIDSHPDELDPDPFAGDFDL